MVTSSHGFKPLSYTIFVILINGYFFGRFLGIGFIPFPLSIDNRGSGEWGVGSGG
jgi:hypothetical protein